MVRFCCLSNGNRISSNMIKVTFLDYEPKTRLDISGGNEVTIKYDKSDSLNNDFSSATDATADRVLLSFGLARFGTINILPIRLRVNEGKFINTTTDDASILMTILGYYRQKL